MDAERKAKLGTKWTCYSCAARFYDLNKPEPLCPKCSADQRESPTFEKPKRTRKAASKKKATRAAAAPRVPAEPEARPAGEIDATGDADAFSAEGLGLDSVEGEEAPVETAEAFEGDS